MTNIRGLRWWVVALISLGAIINYLSRNALGVLAPRLKDQMGISTQQYSDIVGALADTLGYGPLFGLLGVFDLVGATALIVLIGGEREVDRFAAA